MARPRKDQGDSAEQRIKDAFWTLLESNDLKNITVSMITHQAHCNRGTFYYHYDSLDELLDAVIEEEMILECGVPRALFYLICKQNNPFENEEFSLHIKRFGLMMDRAGQECVDTKVKTAVVDIWTYMLCTEGQTLTLDTRLIIEYSTSGLIGLISYLHREGMLESSTMPAESLMSFKTNSQYLVERISEAQNIPLEDLENRICGQLRDASSNSCTDCQRARIHLS